VFSVVLITEVVDGAGNRELVDNKWFMYSCLWSPFLNMSMRFSFLIDEAFFLVKSKT